MSGFIRVHTFPEPEPPTEFKAYTNVEQLFDLQGYSRWEKESAESLEALCVDAANELLAYHTYNYAMYCNKSWIVRKWLVWRKRVPPQTTRADILKELVEKLRRFSSWMEQKQYSSFFMDSDMSMAINKSLHVADLLNKRVAR